MGAWIETPWQLVYGDNGKSHPTWVRGLKHAVTTEGVLETLSHPTWVRGLKPDTLPDEVLPNEGRTLRGCVD